MASCTAMQRTTSSDHTGGAFVHLVTVPYDSSLLRHCHRSDLPRCVVPLFPRNFIWTKRRICVFVPDAPKMPQSWCQCAICRHTHYVMFAPGTLFYRMAFPQSQEHEKGQTLQWSSWQVLSPPYNENTITVNCAYRFYRLL